MRGVRYIVDNDRVQRPARSIDLGLDPAFIIAGLVAMGVLGLVAFGGNAKPDLEAVRAATTAPVVETSAAPKRGVVAGAVLRDCAECPEIVVLPAGFFQVGATEGDRDARPQERPQRGASIRRAFAMGRMEVTVEEFGAFIRETGYRIQDCAGLLTVLKLPQNCVSAKDAQAYATWLARRTGKSYRLPTHDEWEYAAKAHAGGAPATDHIDAVRAVRDTPTNTFGLFGMRGNMAEHVAECWAAGDGDGASDDAGPCAKRTVKDGSWLDAPAQSRPSAKRAIGADVRSERVGFRVARDLDPAERGE